MTEDKMKESCNFRFNSLEGDIKELKSNHDKSLEWIQDVKEAIVRLSLIQKNQQTAIDNQQNVLKKQTVAQNKILSELLEFEKKREETLQGQNKNRKDISAKKIVAISTIISATITAIAGVIAAILT